MKRVSAFLLILIALFHTTSVYAQEQPTGGSALPVSGELEGLIDIYIEEHESSAASVAVSVFEGQETIYTTYRGYANSSSGLMSAPDTVYEWGSVTKLLTWVSIMQMAEQGKLQLTDDIARYLPDGFLSKLKYDEPITFVHLMNHMGGWQETTIDMETVHASEIVALEDALRQTEPPQIYEPGTTYAYSNWGCALAGLVVERLSGMPFYEYVQRNIFAPLGMEHTALAPDLCDNEWVRQQRQLLNCYYIGVDGATDYGTCIRHILLYPAGMATGTLEDMMKFAKALILTDSGITPLFQHVGTLEKMLTPTLYYDGTNLIRSSHGLLGNRYGVDTLGHAGNTAGCTANLVFDPASGRGIVVMTNQLGEAAYTSGLMPLVFGAASPGSELEKQPLDSLAGFYLSTRTYNVGMLRILRILGQGELLPLAKTDDPDRLRLMFVDEAVTQASPGVLDVMGTSLYIYNNDSGAVHLQNFSHDYIRQNTAAFLLQVLLILLIPIGVFYSVIVLLAKLVTIDIRRIKNVPSTSSIVYRWHSFTLISNVVVGVCFYIIITAASYTTGSMWAPCILSAVFALVPIVYAAILFVQRKQKANRPFKVSRGVSAAFGLVMAFNVVFWQSFYFWV